MGEIFTTVLLKNLYEGTHAISMINGTESEMSEGGNKTCRSFISYNIRLGGQLNHVLLVLEKISILFV